jgi:hypothetical protein
VKRIGKYRRKLWNDMENMDEMWNDMENMEEKESWIVRRYEKYWRNPSWIVKRYGKYRRKYWKNMEIMKER